MRLGSRAASGARPRRASQASEQHPGTGEPAIYPLTPWVRRLLVVNVVAFVATWLLPVFLNSPILFQVIRREFALIPAIAVQKPWTIVTYMFLHGDFWHLLFNMIGLFFFGPRLEERLGAADFLKLYFGSGIGAAAFHIVIGLALFQAAPPVVGASGAVFGILAGYALYWPRHEIWIWGVVPVQARWLVLFLLFSSLYSGIAGTRGGVAHFAHLGGLAVGFGYLKWREWRKGAPRRDFQKAVRATPSNLESQGEVRRRWEGIRLDGLHELNRGEVERLLDKMRQGGVASLSGEEKAFLDRMTGR